MLFGFVTITSFILTIGFFNEFSLFLFYLFISLTFGIARPSVDTDSINEEVLLRSVFSCKTS
jgi:hypothetical protein